MSQEILSQFVQLVLEALESDQERDDGLVELPELVRRAQEELSPEELALLLEAVPMAQRPDLWQCLAEPVQRETFLWLLDGTRKVLLKQLAQEESQQLLTQLSAEDLLELAEELPDRFLKYAYSQLDEEQRQRYESAARYNVEELGHWLSFDCPKVSQRLRVQSARNVVRRGGVPLLDTIYTVDRDGMLVGELTLQRLYDADPNTPLSDVHDLEPEVLSADMNIDDAANQIVRSQRLALPVVDTDGRLLGRFDATQAMEHLREVYETQAAQAGGLADEEDLFASVWRSSRNRAVWLGINLLTAFLASWFIGLFEGTLQQVVALAVLMPVVASMGGISGSQTLTVVVRGLAMGQITSANLAALLKKEFRVGCVNGVIWALVIGFVVHLWFQDWALGATICVAILVNIVIAVVAGVYIPSLLNRLNFDPALSGAVILTTVTDIVGFVVFLGIGTLWLL